MKWLIWRDELGWRIGKTRKGALGLYGSWEAALEVVNEMIRWTREGDLR